MKSRRRKVEKPKSIVDVALSVVVGVFLALFVRKGKSREYVSSIVIAVVAALFIRAFFIQAFKIPTGSMEDTLLVGDFLLVNKVIYGPKVPFTDWRLPAIGEPEQGDVIVFKYPEDPSLDYIKRVIAVGGQTIEIRNKVIYVDGKEFRNAPKTKFNHIIKPRGSPADGPIFPPGENFNEDNYGPFTVPENHFFMMGDNRDNSYDSRFWGPVPRDNVVGEALIIYWSWDIYIPLYKIFSKVRWSRIADIIR